MAHRRRSRRVTGETPATAHIIETIGAVVQVGDVLAPLRKTVTAEEAAVFSRTGEFVRNMHDDLEIERAGRLPTLIVQGQQQAGLVGEYCARAFGAAWFAADGSN